jgi:hypothetical protein
MSQQGVKKGMEKISRKRFNVPLDDKVVTEWWNRQPHPSVALRILIQHHVASCGGQILDTVSLFNQLFDLQGTGEYPQVKGTAIPDKEVEAVVKQVVQNKPVEQVKEPVRVVEKEVPQEVVQKDAKPVGKQVEEKPKKEPEQVEVTKTQQPEQGASTGNLMDDLFGYGGN